MLAILPAAGARRTVFSHAARGGVDLDLQLGDDRGLLVDVVRVVASGRLRLVLRLGQVAPRVLDRELRVGLLGLPLILGLVDRRLAVADPPFGLPDLRVLLALVLVAPGPLLGLLEVLLVLRELTLGLLDGNAPAVVVLGPFLDGLEDRLGPLDVFLGGGYPVAVPDAGERGLLLRYLRTGRPQPLARLEVVEPGDDLTRLDMLSDGHVELDELAGFRETQLLLADRLQRSGGGDRRRHAGPGHLHRQRLRFLAGTGGQEQNRGDGERYRAEPSPPGGREPRGFGERVPLLA